MWAYSHRMMSISLAIAARSVSSTVVGQLGRRADRARGCWRSRSCCPSHCRTAGRGRGTGTACRPTRRRSSRSRRRRGCCPTPAATCRRSRPRCRPRRAGTGRVGPRSPTRARRRSARSGRAGVGRPSPGRRRRRRPSRSPRAAPSPPRGRTCRTRPSCRRRTGEFSTNTWLPSGFAGHGMPARSDMPDGGPIERHLDRLTNHLVLDQAARWARS